MQIYSKEVKAIVIDCDSFPCIPIELFKEAILRIKCLFIVSKEENYKELKKFFSQEYILLIDAKDRAVSPNATLQKKVVTKLNLKSYEVAYLSYDYSFIERALQFLSPTILISENIKYTKVGHLASTVVKNPTTLLKKLNFGDLGYYGENLISRPNNESGIILETNLEGVKQLTPLYASGRYYATKHHMRQIHPFSLAITENKNENGKNLGIFDNIFAKTYKHMFREVVKKHTIHGVCSVPPSEGEKNRFDKILHSISTECHIENFSKLLLCTKAIQKQKYLSIVERKENIKDAFRAEKGISGKNVLLIDDIITTGATASECVNALYNAGAKQVLVMVLAINQFKGAYWNNNLTLGKYRDHKEGMVLRIDKDRNFYYSRDYTQSGDSNHEEDFLTGLKRILTEEHETIQEIDQHLDYDLEM